MKWRSLWDALQDAGQGKELAATAIRADLVAGKRVAHGRGRDGQVRAIDPVIWSMARVSWRDGELWLANDTEDRFQAKYPARLDDIPILNLNHPDLPDYSIIRLPAIEARSQDESAQTAPMEKRAIEEASRLLRADPNMTKPDLQKRLENASLHVSDIGFKQRVWPQAREKANLSREGKPGRRSTAKSETP